MNRLHDLIARIVVGAAWWCDRVTCRWANVTGDECDSCGGTGRLYEWQPTGTVEHACSGCRENTDPWGGAA